jgi:hypothetical protein
MNHINTKIDSINKATSHDNIKELLSDLYAKLSTSHNTQQIVEFFSILVTKVKGKKKKEIIRKWLKIKMPTNDQINKSTSQIETKQLTEEENLFIIDEQNKIRQFNPYLYDLEYKMQNPSDASNHNMLMASWTQISQAKERSISTLKQLTNIVYISKPNSTKEEIEHAANTHRGCGAVIIRSDNISIDQCLICGWERPV